MKHVLFVLGLFLLSLPAFAQENYTLSGTVTLNEEPLAGANVMVKNRDEATITNFDGEYSLQLPAGDYTLIFSYGNQKEVEVNLTGNQTLDVDLTNAEETLDEDKFLVEYTKAVVKDWSGLKFSYLEEFLLVDVSDFKPDDLLPWTQDNAELLMKNSNVFDTWVTDTLGELENFTGNK